MPFADCARLVHRIHFNTNVTLLYFVFHHQLRWPVGAQHPDQRKRAALRFNELAQIFKEHEAAGMVSIPIYIFDSCAKV